MKMLCLLIVMFSITYTAYSIKDDSVYCFTKKEITVLANRFIQAEDSISYFKALLLKKDSLSILQDSAYVKAVSQIKLYRENVILWKRKEDEYKNIIKNNQPAWYNNKFLWFGLGVVATIIIAK